MIVTRGSKAKDCSSNLLLLVGSADSPWIHSTRIIRSRWSSVEVLFEHFLRIGDPFYDRDNIWRWGGLRIKESVGVVSSLNPE